MNLWHISTAYRVSQHCCCHVDLLWPKQSTTRMQEGDAHFKKKTRFLHVSQAKDLHGHFELTFLFQLHHLEPLMTLFGRFNKVEARCETSGPKMLRKHVSLDLHLVKLMAFYITSWQAIASTPREQKIGYKICKTHHSRRFAAWPPPHQPGIQPAHQFEESCEERDENNHNTTTVTRSRPNHPDDLKHE